MPNSNTCHCHSHAQNVNRALALIRQEFILAPSQLQAAFENTIKEFIATTLHDLSDYERENIKIGLEKAIQKHCTPIVQSVAATAGKIEMLLTEGN